MFSRSLLPVVMWHTFMFNNGLRWHNGRIVRISEMKTELKEYPEAKGLNAYTISLSKDGRIEIISSR